MNFQDYYELFTKDNYPKFRPVTNKDSFLNTAYSIIPEDYEPCLCLSGKKYKFCCKENFINTYKAVSNRSIAIDKKDIYGTQDKKLLSRKIENKAINKKNISYCFAEKIFSDCSDTNVRSHTMARGNVLKNLSGYDKVIKFNV